MGLLRQRLCHSRPDDIPILQKRASSWYANRGYIDEAFKYALSANNLQLAAQLVEDHGLEYLNKGAVASLSSWFSKLPGGVIKGRPWLRLIFGWVLLLTGRLERIEDYLAAAEKGRETLDNADELRGYVVAIRTYASAGDGNVDMAVTQAHEALELLPPTDLSARSTVSFVLGGVYYTLQIPQALEAFNEVSQFGVQGGNLHVAVSALNTAGSLLRGQGEDRRSKANVSPGSEIRHRSQRTSAAFYRQRLFRFGGDTFGSQGSPKSGRIRGWVWN